MRTKTRGQRTATGTVAVGDARKDWAAGRAVLVVQLRAGMLMTGSLSRSIDGMGAQVEAIEAIGWKLDQFAAYPHKDKTTVVAMFRRPWEREDYDR